MSAYNGVFDKLIPSDIAFNVAFATQFSKILLIIKKNDKEKKLVLN